MGLGNILALFTVIKEKVRFNNYTIHDAENDLTVYFHLTSRPFCFTNLDYISAYKKAKKHLGLHQAILTSRLVKNAYAWLMYCFDWHSLNWSHTINSHSSAGVSDLNLIHGNQDCVTHASATRKI